MQWDSLTLTGEMMAEDIERGKFVWKIAKILLQTACMNKKYFNGVYCVVSIFFFKQIYVIFFYRSNAIR